jgi:hypothetical protein
MQSEKFICKPEDIFSHFLILSTSVVSGSCVNNSSFSNSSIYLSTGCFRVEALSHIISAVLKQTPGPISYIKSLPITTFFF